MKNFGENVPGYSIPVLNEREIRAAAGILFFATFLSMMFIVFTENFIPLKFVLTFFFVDFIIRVFVGPKYSPTLIVGRFIVSNQTPEYVGAAPKKFAWIIGLVLSFIMFLSFNVLNAYSPISGIICLICLIFLFFESSFGICLGCLFYPLFFKDEVLLCPGDVCEVKEKHEIQKISVTQVVVLLSFIAFIVITSITMSEKFSVQPHDLFGEKSIEKTK